MSIIRKLLFLVLIAPLLIFIQTATANLTPVTPTQLCMTMKKSYCTFNPDGKLCKAKKCIPLEFFSTKDVSFRNGRILHITVNGKKMVIEGEAMAENINLATDYSNAKIPLSLKVDLVFGQGSDVNYTHSFTVSEGQGIECIVNVKDHLSCNIF